MLQGYLCVFMAALLWGLIGPVAKFAFAAGAEPLEVAFWRAAFGALFFGVHCIATGAYKARPRDAGVFAMFGVVGVAVFFGSYQVAVKEGGAALASILLYTAPAWVAILSRLVFGEVLSAGKLAALVTAMAGAALVSLGSGGGLPHGTSAWGVFFGMVSGFTYALHYIFGKKYLGSYSAATLYFYILPVGAVCMLPWVHFQPRPVGMWLVFVFMGLFTTYGAYMFYCAALKRLAATRVAVVANLEPVIAAVMAFVWWGEYFSLVGYLGGALVLAGVGIMMWEGRRVARVCGGNC
ncbi:MAG: DMT family transporter [Desulfovibrionaceae bacterium]